MGCVEWSLAGERTRALRERPGPALSPSAGERESRQSHFSAGWCAHAQEFIPIPEAEGGCFVIPVLGEAT